MKISILIPTYNRHELVVKNLLSLNNQTKKNFSVTVFDNGSEPALNLQRIETKYNLDLQRSDRNIDLQSVINQWILSTSGDVVLVLADDDILLPQAIEIVTSIFRYSAEIESLAVGFTRFSHQQNLFLSPQRFSSKLSKYNAQSAAISYLSHWCIGDPVVAQIPRMSHPSTFFFRKNLAEKTIAIQGAFAMTLLWDVGPLGACFNQKTLGYFDANLALIGTEPNTQSNGHVNSPRRCWDMMRDRLLYVPLKSASHFNVAVESHLTVAEFYKERFNINCSLRIEYFLRQLKEISLDAEWLDQTKIDFKEILPFLEGVDVRSYNFESLDLIELVDRVHLFVKNNR
jgi:glycosyltransferase involved in cell wall biosynthesis